MVYHALTVDVEEWFHATALESIVGRFPQEHWESRVVGSTMRLLDMFDAAQAKATFFVLGWIAEQHPNLVKEMARRGHEVASHGYCHTLLTKLSPAEFRSETSRAVHVCEDLTGQKILGFRAPSYSLTKKTLWAFDILLELGILYDSSLRSSPDQVCRTHQLTTEEGAQILEYPLAFLRVGSYNIPVAMGGYFRLYPYQLTHAQLWYLERRKIPANVCLHPWEIDVEHPRLDGLSWLSRFRHYTNLKSVNSKLQRLLRDFRFTSICDILKFD